MSYLNFILILYFNLILIVFIWLYSSFDLLLWVQKVKACEEVGVLLWKTFINIFLSSLLI